MSKEKMLFFLGALKHNLEHKQLIANPYFSEKYAKDLTDVFIKALGEIIETVEGLPE